MRPFIFTLIGLCGFSTGASAQQAPLVPSTAQPSSVAERLRMDSENPSQTAPDVRIKRDGTDNLYTIEKMPDSGSISLDQQGHGNEAELRQDGGTGNNIDVKQSGKGNRTSVHSTGSGNSVIIRQSGE